MIRSRMALIVFVSAASMSLCGLLRADSVWIGINASNPIESKNVQISRVEAGQLVYQTASGTENKKALAQVQQISATGESSLNAAEEAFRAGKLPEAITGYQQAIHGSMQAWVKDRSAFRLVELGDKAGRFDAGVTGYIAICSKDPDAAAKIKPAIPDDNPTALDAAALEVQQALDTGKLEPAKKSALLGFLIDIYRAKKDSAKVNDTMAQLVKLGSGSGMDPAVVHLASARMALDAKDYRKALDEIDANSATFKLIEQEADALFYRASALDGLNSGKEEANGLKDVALAYMRVVALAKDMPGTPHVADSLLRVAALEEKLKEPQVALALYREMVSKYADQPATDAARKAIDRLVPKSP